MDSSIAPFLNTSVQWTSFKNLTTGVDSNSENLPTEALRKIHNNEYSSLLGVLVLGKYEPKDKVIFNQFSDLSAKSRYYFVRRAAIQELARGWHDNPETLKIIKQRAVVDENYAIRLTAVQELARGWQDDTETLKFIKQRVMQDDHWYVRNTAAQELEKCWSLTLTVR